jgi:hypothetical protein
MQYDVYETFVGALWNLAFNPYNVLQIMEDERVPTLVHLCSSLASKMDHFMVILALVYMFDNRFKCTTLLIPKNLHVLKVQN